VSSTYFEHPSVHFQEDLYMQFYGTSFMHPYKQYDRWKDVLNIRFLAKNSCTGNFTHDT